MGACGTAGNIALPSDPNLNDSILNAVPAFGGIDVSWTYPSLNPNAVAYTQVYRSTNEDPVTMIPHRKVTGDYFFDANTTATAVEYFYWIEIVSVNGTVGTLIGPASATGLPPIASVIAGLSGEITEGALSQQLLTQLAEIDTNKSDLYNEIQARAAVDDSLAAAFTQLTTDVDDAVAVIQEERVARISGDDAITTAVDTVIAQVNEDLAAVSVELGSFVDTINGDLADIGAYFSVVTNVNGLIGGFGLYNDGETVEAGFDVDRFWIGSSDDDKVKPFIVDNGTTYINEAVINQLTFDKLRAADGSLIVQDGVISATYLEAQEIVVESANIGDVIQSSNYDDTEGSEAGWRIEKSGLMILNNLLARGTVRGSRIEGSLIIGSLMISGSNITIPTESDTGSGTRLLCFADANGGGSASSSTHSDYASNYTYYTSYVALNLAASQYTGDGTEVISGETVAIDYNRFYAETPNPYGVASWSGGYIWRLNDNSAEYLNMRLYIYIEYYNGSSWVSLATQTSGVVRRYVNATASQVTQTCNNGSFSCSCTYSIGYGTPVVNTDMFYINNPVFTFTMAPFSFTGIDRKNIRFRARVQTWNDGSETTLEKQKTGKLTLTVSDQNSRYL